VKTCKQCMDEACPKPQGPDAAACEDFTSEAIKEEPAVWTPTLDDYEKLNVRFGECREELGITQVQLQRYQNAVAELVRWAQDEQP